MLEAVAPHPTAHPGVQGNVQLMSLVLPTVAAIKHPTFAEEQEWRLLSTSWGASESLRFRPGSAGLVPYVEVSLPDDAVAHVIVGPGRYPRVRISGVAQLLERHGMGGVEVVGSRSPLRL